MISFTSYIITTTLTPEVDQDGAAVSGALIEAKNVKTGTIYRATSTAGGNYTLERLPAGTYELANTVLGLRYRQENIIVQAGKHRTLTSGLWIIP